MYVFFLSNYQPPLISVQPHTQHVGGCAALWILPWCHQRKETVSKAEMFLCGTSGWDLCGRTLICHFSARHRGGMPMCQCCSLCFAAYSWPYPTTSAAKAAIPPSCGQYLVSHWHYLHCIRTYITEHVMTLFYKCTIIDDVLASY